MQDRTFRPLHMTGDMVTVLPLFKKIPWDVSSEQVTGMVIGVNHGNPIPDAGIRGMGNNTWSYWVMLVTGVVAGPLLSTELASV